MNTLKDTLMQFHNNEDGATATEYIILLILIACIIISMVAAFGSILKAKYEAAKNEVNTKVTMGN